jgi:hypothetical protein
MVKIFTNKVQNDRHWPPSQFATKMFISPGAPSLFDHNMQQRYTGIIGPAVFAAILLLMAIPLSAAAQQNDTANETLSVPPMAELGNVSNATVTMYYYDQATGEKGAIVPMPDNPQQVSWDASKAAPGMYTFSKVPTGQSYYLEADNNGNKWFTIFYMAPGTGTHTANVHIPPFQSLNATVAPTPTATPTATPTVIPVTPTPSPSKAAATPGMSGMIALMSIVVAASIAFKCR